MTEFFLFLLLLVSTGIGAALGEIIKQLKIANELKVNELKNQK